jgi:glycerol-3-phosphate acyltransferase PlsY
VTLPDTMRTVAVVAGACVVAAYVLGSIPVGYLADRRALRQRLRRLEHDGRPLEEQLRTILTGSGSGAVVAALDAAKVLLAATLTWQAVVAVSPGGTATTPNQSAVAFVSDQVLVSWQSAALWAGLAAVVGHLAPVWLGFRGDHGSAPALALAVVYAPVSFVAGVVVFFVARAAAGPARVVAAVGASLAAFVLCSWVGWITDAQLAWGVPAGPEATLWAAVLAGVVFARTAATLQPRAAGPGPT